MLRNRSHFIGNARDQIYAFVSDVNSLISRYQEEAKYEPREIL